MRKPTSRTEVRYTDRRGKEWYLNKYGEMGDYVTGVQHGEEYERYEYKTRHEKTVNSNT